MKYVIRNGELVPKEDAKPLIRTQINSDSWIDYESTITRERIVGRVSHREHLKRHNCEETR